MATYSDLVLSLWIVLVIAYFAVGIFFVFRIKKEKEAKERQRIIFLVSFMFSSLALSRLFHLLSVLNNNDSLLFAINQLFLITALIFIIFSFETRITSSTKYILTLSLIVTETLYIVFGQLNRVSSDYKTMADLSSLILASNMLLAGLAIFIIYFKMLKQITGVVYRKTLSIVIGIIFLILSYGMYILSDLTTLSEDLISFISFVCSIISIPLLGYGYI